MSNIIKILNENGQLVVTSRQIAEDFEKRHDNVIRDIENLISSVGSPQNCGHLFIESLYQNEQNKQWYKEYLLTRDGFSLLVMGFTGAKALEWKLKYIEAFNKMEQALREQQKPVCIEDVLITSLQEMKVLKQQLNEVNHHALEAKAKVEETKEELQNVRDIITLNPNSWRTEVTNLLNKIAKERGGTGQAYQEVRNESYKLLDERAGAKLSIRLTNRRRKVLEESGSKSKADKVSKLDCIADDKRLTEVYLAIVKDMAIKNGIRI